MPTALSFLGTLFLCYEIAVQFQPSDISESSCMLLPWYIVGTVKLHKSKSRIKATHLSWNTRQAGGQLKTTPSVHGQHLCMESQNLTPDAHEFCGTSTDKLKRKSLLKPHGCCGAS